MEDLLVKQLTRQLKLLNFWITLFGTLFLVGFIILGVLVYKLVTFTHDTTAKFDALQQKTEQTINVQKQLCDSKNVGSLLHKQTSICK
ncbi:MAG: hypothetical protein QFB86_04465 [Patescibacteria group bacterium]|nr:hypothetical protein [Patescibacteria group bacterium]